MRICSIGPWNMREVVLSLWCWVSGLINIVQTSYASSAASNPHPVAPISGEATNRATSEANKPLTGPGTQARLVQNDRETGGHIYM